MGVLKNGVGRPSNETIKKRNILKIVCVLFAIIIIGLVGYILIDKGYITINKNPSDKVEKEENKKEENNTNETDDKVDISKIKIVNDEDGMLEKLTYDGKEVDLKINMKGTDAKLNVEKEIKQFGNYAVLIVSFIDSSNLYLLNNKGEVEKVFLGSGSMVDFISISTEKLSGEEISNAAGAESISNYYIIDDNKLEIYSNNLGIECSYVCDKKDDEVVVYSDVYELVDGKIKKFKTNKLKTAKEYKNGNECCKN